MINTVLSFDILTIQPFFVGTVTLAFAFFGY